MAVARAIRMRRGAADLSQQELADALGVDRAVVSRIESGERAIRLSDELVAVCGALGCTLRQLLMDATPEQRRVLGVRD